MFDVAVRGWILLCAGAALSLYASRGEEGRPGHPFRSMQRWGERLIGAGLMLQGGAVHFEHLGATGFGWLPWVALVTLAGGVALVCVQRATH